VQDALSRIKEEDSRGGVWDADFASDITVAQIQSEFIYLCGAMLMIGQKEDALGNEVSQNTLRPTRYIPPNFPVTPAKAGSSSRNTSLVDDYSDMAFDEDEPELEAKMAGLKVRSPSLRLDGRLMDQLKNRSQRGILHPNDISKIKASAPPLSKKVSDPPTRPSPMSTHSSPTLQTTVDSPFSPLPYGRSGPGTRANSVRSRTETSESLPELQKYTEDAEEDYSDILDKPSNIGTYNPFD
jgi:hypothetical protein